MLGKLSVPEFECPRANNRSWDTEASGPKAPGPSSRHSQVASKSRSQVSPGADFSDRIAGAAEVCRTSTMEGSIDEDRDLEVDMLTDGKPVKLIPQHRSELPPVRDQPGCSVEDRLQSSHNNVCGTGKRYFCNNRPDLIWWNGPMFSRHPWRVIVRRISAVSTGRKSFEWCCWHAGSFPVHCQMSRRDSWRRSKIRYGVHRSSRSLCRFSTTSVCIQATRIKSCWSSISADSTSFILDSFNALSQSESGRVTFISRVIFITPG